MNHIVKSALGALFVLSSAQGQEGVKKNAPVIVYSSQKEFILKPVMEAFTQETGFPVSIHADKGPVILKKLESEGKNSPADLVVMVDAGNLWLASQRQLLRPFSSQVIERQIPAELRDENNTWTGLSVRTRAVVYHPQRVKLSELSTYEDLASSKWKRRLCMRTSQHVYNQSLVGLLLHTVGSVSTESTVKGWVSNLAQPPFADDTSMLKSMAAGACDVAIANTYYLGRLLQEDPKLPLKVFFPNQKTTGTFVNVYGAGLARFGKNPSGAERLLEWMALPKAQQLFADANFEYPAAKGVKPSTLIQSWGEFKRSTVPLVEAGNRQAEAVRLMDRVGYL